MFRRLRDEPGGYPLTGQVVSATPRSISAGTSPPSAPYIEQMLTSRPLPADVRVTPGDLGSIPVIFIDIADVEPRGATSTFTAAASRSAPREDPRGWRPDWPAAGIARVVDYRLAPSTLPRRAPGRPAAYRALAGRRAAPATVAANTARRRAWAAAAACHGALPGGTGCGLGGTARQPAGPDLGRGRQQSGQSHHDDLRGQRVRPGREAEPITHSPSWPPSRPHTRCQATCGLPRWRGSRISGCRERRSRPIASAALGTFRRPERATGTIEPERRLACWCAPTSGRSVETIRC